MDEPIDLVCPWVDGSDSAWQAERNKYAEEAVIKSDSNMFRDWGLMRYWFRGVERGLPWIRTIHFVTWGHLPSWLNIDHPKLNIVRHTDFIPAKYLPTFNSNVISLNVNRIPGLAEQFIYTNDDIFFLDIMKKKEYFQDGLPCDCLHLFPITEECTNSFGHILWNNISCINVHFNPGECWRKHADKWFAPSYPNYVLEDNRKYSGLRHFPGIADSHLAIPMLKSTFEEVWEKESEKLSHTCRQRFRSSEDLSEWLIRYWQLMSGKFVPYVRAGERYVKINAGKEELRLNLLSTKTRVICMNEGEDSSNFERRREYLIRILEIIFPEKSTFEL